MKMQFLEKNQTEMESELKIIQYTPF